jgi:glycyl-tRNA synthetase
MEASGGVDRSFLVTLLDAYREEKENNKTRVYLKLKPEIAPYKIAISPLLANKNKLVEKAKNVYSNLNVKFNTAWDDHGNIGKRYRRQDEIGTPWCVTIDFDTLEDDTVTVRDRDTMEQERVDISELESYFKNRLNYYE